VGGFSKDGQLMGSWRKFQKERNFSDTPAEFRDDFKSIKAEMDSFVHAGSFPKYTDQELKEVAERFNTRDMNRFRPTFEFLFGFSRYTCMQDGTKWFEY
jgi:hypothetical protein